MHVRVQVIKFASPIPQRDQYHSAIALWGGRMSAIRWRYASEVSGIFGCRKREVWHQDRL